MNFKARTKILGGGVQGAMAPQKYSVVAYVVQFLPLIGLGSRSGYLQANKLVSHQKYDAISSTVDFKLGFLPFFGDVYVPT